MQKKFMKWTTLLFLGALVVVACDFGFDDKEITNKLDTLERRVSEMESTMSAYNQDIASMQAIVQAYDSTLYIKDVSPTATGYHITFSNNSAIDIFHGMNGLNGNDGQVPYIGDNGNWWIGGNDTGYTAIGRNGNNGADGHDGVNGRDGQDGQDGQDGLVPYIGSNRNWWIGNTDTGIAAMVTATDVPIVGIKEVGGVYYWTLTVNGQTNFITDDHGNNIPVSGGNAHRPIIRVNNAGYWQISYDGGINYEDIYDVFGYPVQISGQGGEDTPCQCTTFFLDVSYSNGILVLVLADGQVVRIDTNYTPGSDGNSQLEREYFTIDGATYHDGTAPDPTIGETVGDVTVNDRALSGGLNFVTIRTTVQYYKFYVFVRGISGYFEFIPKSSDFTFDGTTYVYTIPLLYSEGFSASVHYLIIIGVRMNGDTTTGTEKEVTHVDSQSGDLNINLTFSQAKDVDLHLYLPDGTHIYYGNRGYNYTDANGESQRWGLDHDSNAGCSIDNLNNENIFIPAEAIQAGTYRVVLDMYSNCSPRTNPTRCDVVARYKGQLLYNSYGDHANPVTMTYDTNCGNGDHTTIMEFTINDAQVTRTRSLAPMYLSPIEPTDMDIMKMEEAEWNQSVKK